MQQADIDRLAAYIAQHGTPVRVGWYDDGDAESGPSGGWNTHLRLGKFSLCLGSVRRFTDGLPTVYLDRPTMAEYDYGFDSVRGPSAGAIGALLNFLNDAFIQAEYLGVPPKEIQWRMYPGSRIEHSVIRWKDEYADGTSPAGFAIDGEHETMVSNIQEGGHLPPDLDFDELADRKGE